MPLEEYRRKRDFSATPEPAGDPGPTPPPGGHRRFVVQKHRATRLHYDLRLEVDGVLVSWAVPKGPTLDPKARRMAVHVEDHPLEYFDFEGIIPGGQYGAGDVIVWDWGTWEPEEQTPDPAGAIESGELKFRLAGQRLAGRFTIVRTSQRGAARPARQRAAGGSDARGAHVVRGHGAEDADLWLLIHKADEHAVPGWDAADHPTSVRSGRTNDEVAAEAPAIWVSAAPTAEAEIDLSAAVPAPLPRTVDPMAATLTTAPFDDEDWLFEVKWDGFRLLSVVSAGQPVRLLTRNGNDARAYFPTLLDDLGDWIDAREAVLDGEAVALDERGRPDFSLLQERITTHRAGAGPSGLLYVVFDLLHLDGRSLLDVPLEERKKLLRLVLHDNARVRYAEHIVADGRAFYAAAEQQGLEGIVAKHRRSRYQPGKRSTTWQKMKIRAEQELVVGGWTPGKGRAQELGALVVGVHDGTGLRYAGRVGSGFTAQTRTRLLAELAARVVDECPFDTPPPTDSRGRWGGDLAGVTWVRPDLVIRAALGGWSRDGLVRQASYRGLEAGRDAAAVVREVALPVRQAEAAGEELVAEQAAAADAVPARVAGARNRADGAGGAPASEPISGAPPPAFAPATADELAALDAAPLKAEWTIGAHTLALTNLDKQIFPARSADRGRAPDAVAEEPVTKRDLVHYFAQIAPAMLPHLAGRPLNLHRFPNGVGRPGFWQKDMPSSTPQWLSLWQETGVDDKDRAGNAHLVADSAAALAWLANQTAFEIHAWTSTCADPAHPTFALIDIDPGEATTWEQTLQIAQLYRTALDHLGVRGHLKTTGARGLQAWIPVEQGRYTFADTSAWVEQLSRAVGAMVPDLVSWEWSTRARGGRARLDYTQNAPIKTLVSPYAVRPRPGAPVSMPITWDELDDPELRSDRWTVRDAPDRVARIGDLFAAAQTDPQVLPRL